MKQYIVAIDGGGSGTRSRLYDAETHKVIGEGCAGASSLSLGIDSAWNNIQRAIQNAWETSDQLLTNYYQQPHKMVAGLAGSRNLSLREALQEKVPSETKLSIVSDAYTSALGAHRGSLGITISIGTGLAACRIDTDFQIRYTSGWGFKVGDEGAGSWIGLQAVQAYLKHLDGREKISSLLFPIIAAEIGTDAADIQRWCRDAIATHFAALARKVAECALESNDELAIRIMRAASIEVEQAIAAIDDTNEPLPIALLGGLASAISPYLSTKIQARLVLAQGTALDGAAKIVLGECPTEKLEDR